MTDPRLTLEERIEAELKSYDGTMGLYIDDLKGNVITRFPDEKFETASTIKVYILAALFDAIGQGKASLKDMLTCEERFWIDGSGILGSLEVGTTLSVKNVATLMIIVSDNIATNMLIDYLGIDNINACIQKLGCKDTVLHNVLDFAKYHQLGTTTPYGSYVIVKLNKNFSDKQYYPDHPATVFGSRVSRLIFDQYLTLEGRLK